jgi:tetratricopeptide (TPR) repeat protein
MKFSMFRKSGAAVLIVGLALFSACGGKGEDQTGVRVPGPDRSPDAAPIMMQAAEGTTEPEAISLLGEKLYAAPPSAAALAAYEKAREAFDREPTEENTIWLGRRAAYLGRYREAVRIFSAGLERFPESYRLLRHRGHRHITLRRFDDAVADFRRAADLAASRPRETEPDGAPNRLGVPLSNTHFNIWYHLGLAHYLQGRFEEAESAYRECLKWSDNDDLLTATSDWLYMTLRRLGQTAEADAVLERITPEMNIIENGSYHNRLLMYKGLKAPEDLLTPSGAGTDPDEASLNLATQGYGVGNWYLYNGDIERAAEIFRNILKAGNWAAFGAIAAEADLARL